MNLYLRIDPLTIVDLSPFCSLMAEARDGKWLLLAQDRTDVNKVAVLGAFASEANAVAAVKRVWDAASSWDRFIDMTDLTTAIPDGVASVPPVPNGVM